MEFKLNKNYFELLSKYISNDILANEIQSNIEFVEKYIDKIDDYFTADKEKQLAYRQLGSMVFACVEALWKSLILLVNKNCKSRSCKEENCKYHQYEDVSKLNYVRPKEVLTHLVNMRLLNVHPFEEETIDSLQNLRNHIHLTRTLIDGDKSEKFTKQFVENTLRLYYVTINQAEMNHWYYDEPQPCLRELDDDVYEFTNKQQKNTRKEYFTNKIILACIDIFYKKPVTEKTEYFLHKLSKPKDLDIKKFADEMGKWLYYAGAHFRTEESYQEALSYFNTNLNKYLTDNDTINQINERKNYYDKLFNEQ